MPMCAYGKGLYDEWSRYGEILDVLKWRSAIDPLFRPEIKIDLSYKEAEKRGISAQQSFLDHQSFCSDCSSSWGRPAGYLFKSSR